ncbi:MAG: hypothetical protein H6973_07695 [Gammaproteobacteria bacterium]|nr:hypothetical protein [Gammaproteobacteria bacterium]HRX70629.1 hypothetical protein [Candidatus Competibacteraceae bacterium]
MLTRLHAWWSIEAFWFWLVPILLVVVYAAPSIGLEWLLQPKNGYGRLLDHPEVAVLHGFIAVSMLALLLVDGKVAALSRVVLGWVAVAIGFYSYWWPGMVATGFPLIFGGIRIGIPSRRAKVHEKT